MNPIEAIKLFGLYEKAQSVLKEKGPMNASTISQIAMILVGAAGAVNASTVANGFVAQHVMLCAILYALAQVLHAVLPSIFGAPASAPPSASTPVKVAAILALAVLIPVTVHAQTATAGTTTPATTTSNGFSASGGAIALHYAGAWSAASVERESFDFLDFGATKANHLYAQGLELEMPTPGVNAYLGGVTIQPNIASLFKETNLPAGALGVFFDGNIGNGLPTTGGSHITWLAGGGVLYNFTGALTWQPLTVQYGRFGTNGFVAMSTQLQFMFDK